MLHIQTRNDYGASHEMPGGSPAPRATQEGGLVQGLYLFEAFRLRELSFQENL